MNQSDSQSKECKILSIHMWLIENAQIELLVTLLMIFWSISLECFPSIHMPYAGIDPKPESTHNNPPHQNQLQSCMECYL